MTEDEMNAAQRRGEYIPPMRGQAQYETAWLIERHDIGIAACGPHYYFDHERGHGWTPDASAATRFPNEQAARAACLGGDTDGPLLVVEHMWIGKESQP